MVYLKRLGSIVCHQCICSNKGDGQYNMTCEVEYIWLHGFLLYRTLRMVLSLKLIMYVVVDVIWLEANQ